MNYGFSWSLMLGFLISQVVFAQIPLPDRSGQATEVQQSIDNAAQATQDAAQDAADAANSQLNRANDAIDDAQLQSDTQFQSDTQIQSDSFDDPQTSANQRLDAQSDTDLSNDAAGAQSRTDLNADADLRAQQRQSDSFDSQNDFGQTSQQSSVSSFTPAIPLQARQQSATGLSADADRNARWRFAQRNGEWWYYTPQNNWMYYRNNQWERFNESNFQPLATYNQGQYGNQYGQYGNQYGMQPEYRSGYRGTVDGMNNVQSGAYGQSYGQPMQSGIVSSGPVYRLMHDGAGREFICVSGQRVYFDSSSASYSNGQMNGYNQQNQQSSQSGSNQGYQSGGTQSYQQGTTGAQQGSSWNQSQGSSSYNANDPNANVQGQSQFQQNQQNDQQRTNVQGSVDGSTSGFDSSGLRGGASATSQPPQPSDVLDRNNQSQQ